METEPESFMNVQDVIEHDKIKIKLIDILVYLNCLEVTYLPYHNFSCCMPSFLYSDVFF